MQLTPRVHRIGDDLVACYLIEEAGEVTIVDAGLPGLYQDFVSELEAMGRSIEDVRALVLTHGHSDHIGFAERVRTGHDVPVSVHDLDAGLARGEDPNPSAGAGAHRWGSILSFMVWSARHGALRTKSLLEVGTYAAGATLDVPGALTVIATPGHTPGSCVLHAAGHDVAFVGDALATLNVMNGRRGPQISPFTADPDLALASLANLEPIAAKWLLPGHGAPWTEGAAAAVASARTFGIEHLPRP